MVNNKVSFIVPVYNVEQYLAKCIESILAQDYGDIELIIINDGSPDGCQGIIDEYARKDKRVVAVQQENKGVSAARNAGLRLASGGYILFVDSDDYVDADYATKFVNLIEGGKADMAVSYNLYDEDKKLPRENNKVWKIDGDSATVDLYLGKLGVAVWNKIYSRSFLEKNRIRFDEGLWFAEGMTFNVKCFQKAKKIVAGDIKAYHQVKNPTSAVRKFRLESWQCGMKAMNRQHKIIDKSNHKVKRAWEFHFRAYYYSILWGIISNGDERKYSEEVLECRESLKEQKFLPLKVDLPMRRKLRWAIIAVNPMIMIRARMAKQIIGEKLAKLRDGGGYNRELVWGDRQSVGGFDFASSRYSKRLVWSSHQLDGRVGEFLMSVFSLKY